MTGEGDGLSSATGSNHMSQPLNAIVDWALGPRRGGGNIACPLRARPSLESVPQNLSL